MRNSLITLLAHLLSSSLHSHLQQSKLLLSHSRSNHLRCVTHLSSLSLQSSKSKASKLSKQAKVFASKSDKSGTVKSGKSGKGGKALFQESSEGTGWWSASRTVSYLNSGSDYIPFGLERKSSASVMHGAGWIVIATAVLFSSTFVH